MKLTCSCSSPGWIFDFTLSHRSFFHWSCQAAENHVYDGIQILIADEQLETAGISYVIIGLMSSSCQHHSHDAVDRIDL